MDQGPLVMEAIDAGAELAREFDKFAPVKVAFWIKASDDDFRYLYLASDQVDDGNIDLAYREILRLTKKLDSLYLDPFRVKLLNAEDPLAKAAGEINLQYPSRKGTRLGGNFFGGLSVDEGYLYPSPLPTPVS